MARSVADRIKRRRLPSVDAPKTDDQSVRQFLEGVKEHFRMYEGDSGAPKERFATIEELETAGLIATKIQGGFATITESAGVITPPVPSKTTISLFGGGGGGGGGGGIRTLAALDDTSVSGIAAGEGIVWNGSYYIPTALPAFDLGDAGTYDMIFKSVSAWEYTASLLQWNPDLKYLQLANAHSINWLNLSSASIALVDFEQTGAASAVMDYYTFETFTESAEAGTSYVDTANGLDQSQAGMVNGDVYMIFTRALVSNDNSGAANSNGFRVIASGGALTGSEMLYEGINGASPVTYGNPYSYMGFFTANTAGAAVKTQHKKGSAGTNHLVNAETSFILNLDTDVPNHQRSSSITELDLDEVGFKATNAAVALAAGDWVIFASVQIADFNGANTPQLGIYDGSSTIPLAASIVEDSGTDLYCLAGTYYLDNFAGGPITVMATAGSASGAKITKYQAICALPLSDFREGYAIQDAGTAEQNLAAQSVEEVIETLSVPAIANTGTDFVALGWVATEFVGTSLHTGIEVLEEIDGGGDTLIAWDLGYVNRKNTAPNMYASNNMFSSVRSYTAGQAVDIKLNAINDAATYNLFGHKLQGAALLSMETPDTLSEDFTVGDSSYRTVIDGASISLTAAVTVNGAVSASNFTGDYIQFNLDYTDGVAEGRMQWNGEDGTLEVGMPGGNVNLQVGQEHLIRCRNTTGSAIPNGAPVYVIGASGNKPLIALADASDISTAHVLGVATETIGDNSNGFVTISGLVRDVDTSGMAAGDVLWLSETAGEFTNTEPSHPAVSVDIGHVIAVHATAGVILVVSHHPEHGPKSEVVTAANVITALENDTTFYLDAAGGFTSTLPVPAIGLKYRFVIKTAPTTAYTITTNAGANILFGTINEITATAGISVQAQDTLNFVASTALIGDWVDVESDGTNWYVRGATQVDDGITAAVT